MVLHFDPQRTVLGTVFTHAGEEELALSELDRMLALGPVNEEAGIHEVSLLLPKPYQIRDHARS
jgi:hypothetical protein